MSAAKHRLRQSEGWLLRLSDERRRKIIGYGGNHMSNRKKYPHNSRNLGARPQWAHAVFSASLVRSFDGVADE